MTGTDAIFTAINQGDLIKAMELCFRGAGDDLEERRFCCLLAGRLGLSPEDKRLPPTLREGLLSCPIVLKGGGAAA